MKGKFIYDANIFVASTGHSQPNLGTLTYGQPGKNLMLDKDMTEVSITKYRIDSVKVENLAVFYGVIDESAGQSCGYAPSYLAPLTVEELRTRLLEGARKLNNDLVLAINHACDLELEKEKE